jgi:membrane-associated phospholipid phosphatase
MRTDGPPEGPVEARLADRLSGLPNAPGPARSATVGLLRRVGRLDQRAYDAVAGWSAPVLDAPLRELSHLANFSKPWLVTAACLAVAGGPSGRRAALTGVAAIAVTSLVVNQPMKLAGNRARPDRERAGVPRHRWVRMPTSSSFPSGHSASAAAFAVAVGDACPPLRVPLGVSAVAVAFSRVYTGVHYPGDVLVGASVGIVVGRMTSRAFERLLVRRLTGVHA